MSAWGPQASGTAFVPQVHRGGAWMWVLPILWACTGPVWLMWLIASSVKPYDIECPPMDFMTGTTPPCPAADAAVDQQMSTYGAALFWFNAVGFAVAGAVGLAQARARTGFMYGRVGLMIFTGLVAMSPLVGYAVGYGLGHLGGDRATRRTQRQAGTVLTVAQQYLAAPAVVPAVQQATRRRYGREVGTVLGWTVDGWDDLVTATPRGGVLVLGPPGSGKTSAVLIPTVMIAPGACVSSSIKADVMNATAAIRSRIGRCWHFDPGGDEPTPPGVQRARWSPLVSVRSWDDALQVGASMSAALTLNAAKGGSNADHFVGRATDWLQVLLYAAHLDGRAIADVAEWAMSAAAEESQTQVMEILDAAEQRGNAGARIAGQKLLGLISTPDKERGSIISTLVGLLRVYDSVSARELGVDPNFDPRAFVRSTDTLYITARPDRQALYAPLLAALLEAIRLETYDRHKRIEAGIEPRLPHVTFALDEANTTAPIPLPAIISEAGGQGLHLAVGMQAIGPAVARWGEAAKSFLTLFPVKVIFRGTFDADTVQALSNAAGEYDRQMTSYSQSTSYVGEYNMPVTQVNPTYSVQRQKVLTMGDITSIPDGLALVWDGPDWSLLAVGMHWQSGVWQTATNQARALSTTTTAHEIEGARA